MFQANNPRRVRVLFIILIAVMLAVAVACITFGRYPLSIAQVIQAFTALFTGETVDNTVASVVYNLRTPRIILAIILGAGLACAGAAFQSLFSNPLATPDTLGVTSGASVGAVIGLLLERDMLTVQLMALVFGVVAVMLTVMTASIRGQTSTVTLILSGVIISALLNAVLSGVKLIADPNSQLQSITFWLMGSLAGASFQNLAIGAGLIVLGIVILFLLRWRLNLMTLSEDEIRAAGIRLQRTRMLVIVAATMITASCVSMCGQVSWIGLLIPHCARMICGSNNRFVIPFSIVLGAIFVLILDTIARTIIASEIPISILTSVIGAPLFIILLRRTGGGWK